MAEDLTITAADYSQVRTGSFLPDEILRKTGVFWASQTYSHIIDKTSFDSVFVTSDIHADLYKLNFLLSAAGLIDSTGAEERDQILNGFNWLKPRTLLVIVGDIVDGAREGVAEIYDPVGDIELLLHVYLYNLRLKARSVGSEIRIIIGNHDYHSAIKINSDDMPDFYNAWVHQSAKVFFGTRDIRRLCLLPFYMCSPYFFLRIEDEIAFVHGGLHSYYNSDIVNLAQDVSMFQTELDKTGNLSTMSDEAHSLYSTLAFPGPAGLTGGPLWTRYYSLGKTDEVCANLGNPFKMIVVGHCRTDQCNRTPGSLMNEISMKFGSACSNGGCVLLGCDKAGAPQVGFVDISMSSAFRNYKQTFWDATKGKYETIVNLGLKKMQERIMRAELLKLVHDPSKLTGERYYNVISREKVSGAGAKESLVYWQAPAVGGSRRSRRKTFRKKKF